MSIGMYLLYTSFIGVILAGILAFIGAILNNRRPGGEVEAMVMGAATLSLAVSCLTFLAIGFIGKV